jgi:hypothetical protein
MVETYFLLVGFLVLLWLGVVGNKLATLGIRYFRYQHADLEVS